jgi:hypothetical protein
MELEMLNEHWDQTKETLLDGLKESKKAVVGKVLENTRQHMLAETAAAGSTQAHDIAGFRKTLLPMIRRIIPGTIATELVGVQPMAGPVGLVYTLRYKYEEDMTHNPASSQFGGFDISAGDEAFGNDVPIRQFYAGNTGSAQTAGASGIDAPGADGTSAPFDIDAATAEGGAWESSQDVTTYGSGTSTFSGYSVNVGGTMLGGSGSFVEGSGGRKMTLEVISQAVEAGSRKLQSGWTIEAMQDLNSQHGLDLESEITKALSAEIVLEIDAEIINDLLALAGTVRTFDFAQTAGTTYAPAFVGDRFANLGVRIHEVANVIARKTRRGAGNYVVVSPMIVSVLQSAAKAVFAPAVEGEFKGPNNTELVGTMNGSIKVYSYLWNQAAPGTSAPNGTDKILVGYKGGDTEVDAGYFYAPYVPLMSSGVIVNPVTFQPVVSLMTRYGKVALTDPTTSLGNSADYYGRINVVNLEFL